MKQYRAIFAKEEALRGGHEGIRRVIKILNDHFLPKNESAPTVRFYKQRLNSQSAYDFLLHLKAVAPPGISETGVMSQWEACIRGEIEEIGRSLDESTPKSSRMAVLQHIHNTYVVRGADDYLTLLQFLRDDTIASKPTPEKHLRGRPASGAHACLLYTSDAADA